MKIHRFIGDFDLDKETLIIDEKNLVHQIGSVLRLQKNEYIIVSDGKGYESKGLITSITKKDVMLSLEEKYKGIESKNSVHLYLCEIKRDLFELAVQKATECGVNSITPIISSRTLKKNLSTERLRVIAKEASEQCGRSTLPIINEPEHLDNALKLAIGTKIFCNLAGEEIRNINEGNTYSIFIGPEGGWSDEEILEAKSNGAIEVSLGQTTLRAETAAIISTFLFANK